MKIINRNGYILSKKYFLKKILLIMKLTMLIMWISVLSVSATSYAQTKKINLDINNGTLEDLITQIEDHSEFSFFFSNDIDLDHKVTINVADALINSVLSDVLVDMGINYKIHNKHIVLYNKDEFMSPNQDQLKENNPQQEIVITGIVKDDKGELLPGVNIYIKGTNIGTTTNAEGEYSIVVPNTEVILVFSFVGYSQKEIKVGTNRTIDVVLMTTISQLDEIVVTGVASETSVKKLSFTVDKIDRKMIQNVPAINVGMALQGKIPGLKISTSTGMPGEEPEIQIRGAKSILGSSQPLIIVDGILTEGGLVDINTQDITSIEVIKGAAATSLYGSRAANGVINITTERGSGLNAGVSQVNYRMEYGSMVLGLGHLPSKVEAHPFILNSDGTFQLDASGNRIWEPDQIYDNPYPTGTDLESYKQFFKNSQTLTNNLSFVGKTESGNTNYYASIQYTTQNGMIKLLDGMQRYNIRLNLDHRFLKNLKFSASNMFVQTNIDKTATDWYVFDNIWYADPDANFLADNFDGSPYLVNPGYLDPFVPTNPLYLINNSSNIDEKGRFLGHYLIDYKPFEDLNISASYGIDYSNIRNKAFETKGMLDRYDPINNPRSIGWISQSNSNTIAQNLTTSILYSKIFGDFTTRLKAQYLYEDNKYYILSGSGSSLAVNDPDLISLEIAQEDIDNYSYESLVVAQNYSGMAYIDYKEKYILDALYRKDGVSLFGPESRWQDFYRIAGAWRLTEDFNVPGFSELKIRAAYGKAGLRPTFEDQYESYDISNGVIGSGENLGNKLLKPAISYELELGIDAEFLKRYYFKFSYSKNTNRNQIFSVPVLGALGYQYQMQNAGEIESKVFEFTLGGTLIRTNNFSWNLNIMTDHIMTVVTDLASDPFFMYQIFKIEEGKPYGVAYGSMYARSLDDMRNYEIFGNIPQGQTVEDIYVVNNEGYVVRRDAIGTIDEQRQTMINDDGTRNFKLGSIYPDLTFNINSDITWKNWNLYTLFSGQFGGVMFNFQRMYMRFHRVGEEIDQSDKPYEARKSLNYYESHSRDEYTEDATFLKLRELSLSYTLNQLGNSKLRFIKNLRLGLTGRNLFTLTNYTGIDPEGGRNTRGYSSNIIKMENTSYPSDNFPTLTADISITF